jgi:hypothetical protein
VTPRLEACCFNGGNDGKWTRLARVLALSASQHCASWDVQIRTVVPPRLQSALGIPSHVHNTQKMEHWHRIVTEAPDGACVLLIDADTMILRPLDDVWAQEFDLGYTTKESRFPFNSGVVFVRVSDRVRAFVTSWRDENRRMLGDARHHQVWRKQYGGINQAALGCLLAKQAQFGLSLAKLPCLEWNCEDSHWAKFDPEVTRIVHIKGALRRAAFLRPQVRPLNELEPLVTRWRDLDDQACRSVRRAS